MHHVDKSGPWPAMQRYDYFVREQPLSRTALKELAVLLLETSNQDATLQSLNKKRNRESRATLNDLVAVLLRTNSEQSYPQRDAALYALRKITDVKLGDSSREWRKHLALLPSLSF